MESLILTVILILLTFGSGFFSSCEVAFFSLSKMQIHACRDDGNPRNRLIAQLLLRPRDLLVTVFMLNTLVNVLLQNVASDLFGTFAGWELKVGVPLAITLVLGEIIPKNIGIEKNRALAYLVAPTISWLQTVIAPLRRGVIKVTTPVSRLLFFYLKKSAAISKDELQHALSTSTKSGVLSRDEADLARGYLNLYDVTVKEVMRPKDAILFYLTTEPITKLIYLFTDQQCSRVPVCDGDLQKPLGVISATTFFLECQEISDPHALTPFLEQPFFVPESISVKKILHRLTKQPEKLALVINEYGAISGLLTDEDIAELVVGEINDLRDDDSLYSINTEGELICDGRLELNDFNTLFGVALCSKVNAVTVAGWLIEQIGAIPKAGSHYSWRGLVFQILAADPNKIKRVYIRKQGEGDE